MDAQSEPLSIGRRQQYRSFLPAAALAALALAAATFVPPLGLGAVSHHMARHIFLMDVVAPLLAMALLGLCEGRPRRSALATSLVWATTAQLTVLWIWHAPAALEAAASAPVAGMAMQVSLLAGATWFWFAVLVRRGPDRWRAMFALLVTAKLFCLLGVLLTFSPRVLYALEAHHAGAAAGLADQQLAGLIMLSACPLTYVAAGIYLAYRWLGDLEAGSDSGSADLSCGPAAPRGGA